MPPSKSPQNKPLLARRIPVFYGWLILPVASLALFVSGPGQTYTVSIFVEPIMRDLGWSRTLVSSIYTAGSLSAAVTMILVGRLLDRYGARTMLMIVGILFGLAVMGMSRIQHPLELYFGFAALRILGQGSLTLIPTTLVALWFSRARGKATAIASLGSAASSASIPIITHLLISQLGWRNAWITLGLMIWVLLLPPVATIVRRNPESVGMRPDGDTPTPQVSSQQVPVVTEIEADWRLAEALRTRSFWLLLFASSSLALISTALVFHQVSIFAGMGLHASLAPTTMTIMALMSMIGTLLGGYLVDKFPTRYILASAQGIVIIAMLWTFAISEPWEALAYGGLLGLGGGLFMTTSTVIWPNYFGRNYIGSIRGAATTAMVGFAAIGPVAFSLLFDLTGNFSVAIITFLPLPATCALAAYLALPPVRRSVDKT